MLGLYPLGAAPLGSIAVNPAVNVVSLLGAARTGSMAISPPIMRARMTGSTRVASQMLMAGLHYMFGSMNIGCTTRFSTPANFTYQNMVGAARTGLSGNSQPRGALPLVGSTQAASRLTISQNLMLRASALTSIQVITNTQPFSRGGTSFATAYLTALCNTATRSTDTVSLQLPTTISLTAKMRIGAGASTYFYNSLCWAVQTFPPSGYVWSVDMLTPTLDFIQYDVQTGNLGVTFTNGFTLVYLAVPFWIAQQFSDSSDPDEFYQYNIYRQYDILLQYWPGSAPVLINLPISGAMLISVRAPFAAFRPYNLIKGKMRISASLNAPYSNVATTFPLAGKIRTTIRGNERAQYSVPIYASTAASSRLKIITALQLTARLRTSTFGSAFGLIQLVPLLAKLRSGLSTVITLNAPGATDLVGRVRLATQSNLVAAAEVLSMNASMSIASHVVDRMLAQVRFAARIHEATTIRKGVLTLTQRTGAQGDKLPYSPPALTNPVVIQLTQSGPNAYNAGGQDVQLLWPIASGGSTSNTAPCNTPIYITNARNLVSIGGQHILTSSIGTGVTVTAAGVGNYGTGNQQTESFTGTALAALHVANATGVVYIEGLYSNPSVGGYPATAANGGQDAIKVSSFTTGDPVTVVMQNVAVNYVAGNTAATHGSILTASDLAPGDTIYPMQLGNMLVDHCSLYTQYQGLFVPSATPPSGSSLPGSDFVISGPLYLTNTNIASTSNANTAANEYLFWLTNNPDVGPTTYLGPSVWGNASAPNPAGQIGNATWVDGENAGGNSATVDGSGNLTFSYASVVTYTAAGASSAQIFNNNPPAAVHNGLSATSDFCPSAGGGNWIFGDQCGLNYTSPGYLGTGGVTHQYNYYTGTTYPTGVKANNGGTLPTAYSSSHQPPLYSSSQQATDLAAIGGTLPSTGAVNLAYMPAIFNQGNYATCTGQVISAILCFASLKGGFVDFTTYPPSRMMMYYWGQKLESYLTYGVYYGSETWDVMAMVNNYGIASESVVPYTMSSYTEPLATSYTSAATVKPTSFFNLNATGTSLLTQIETCVAAGYPVAVQIQIYASWYNSTTVLEDGVVPMPSPPSDLLIGNHAIVITGYNNSTQIFNFRNSWGTTFGPQSNGSPNTGNNGTGYGTIPYAYISNSTYTPTGLGTWTIRTVTGTASGGGGVTRPSWIPANWTLQRDWEFGTGATTGVPITSMAALVASGWYPQSGYNNSSELETFNSAQSGNNNYQFYSDHMDIVAIWNGGTIGAQSGAISSGQMAFNTGQAIGYYECMCQVPGAISSWPAFWAIGSTNANGTWGGTQQSNSTWGPEIDCFEFFVSSSGSGTWPGSPSDGNPYDGAWGTPYTVCWHLHSSQNASDATCFVPGSWPTPVIQATGNASAEVIYTPSTADPTFIAYNAGKSVGVPVNYSSAYHTYGFMIDAEYGLHWYIDGVYVASVAATRFTQDNSTSPVNVRLIFNLAMGANGVTPTTSNFGGTNNATETNDFCLKVKYIRAWGTGS